MNFLDILKSVEEAAYEISLWVILIPKTLYKIIFHPMTVPEFVRSELAKDEKKQFNEYMSPVLLWLLLVVIPAYFIIIHFNSEELKKFIGNKNINYVFYITTVLIGFLLSPALLIHASDRRKFDKDSFREPFFIQCYLQTPVSFLGLSCLAVMRYFQYDFDAMDQENYILFLNDINGWKDIFMIAVFGLLFYAGFIQYKVLRKTGKTQRFSLMILGVCLIMSGFIMLATAGIGFILFFGIE